MTTQTQNPQDGGQVETPPIIQGNPEAIEADVLALVQQSQVDQAERFGALSAKLEILEKRDAEKEAVIRELQARAQTPPAGPSPAEIQARQPIAQSMSETIMDHIRPLVEDLQSGLVSRNKDGEAERVVDFGALYAQADKARAEAGERKLRRSEKLGAYLWMQRDRQRRAAMQRQALYGGRYDETSGSLAHYQPQVVEPGLVKEPMKATSVLTVLGVRPTANQKRIFSRRTKMMAMVAEAKAQTASGAGPHTFNLAGGFHAWEQINTTYDGSNNWPLIVRHVNGTEETGFTLTTQAALNSNQAEKDLGHFTLGVTGSLSANLEVGDIVFLADPADTTKPLQRLPTGVGEGELKPYGKLITAQVDRYAVKFPIRHDIPDERLEDEEELMDEIEESFDQMIQETVPFQVFSGSGSGAANQSELLGMLNVTGIQTQNKVAGENDWDTIQRAVQKIRTQGFTGEIAVFVHPDVEGRMLREKNDDKDYLSYPEMQGVSIYPESFISYDTDTAVAVAAGAYEVFEWGQTRFAMTNSHGDNFDKDVTSLRWVPWFLVQDKQPLGICQIDLSP